jgi:hypothetical protein
MRKHPNPSPGQSPALSPSQSRDLSPDQSIDQVLHGLRDSQPSAQMEHRILATLEATLEHALQNPASVRSPSKGRRLPFLGLASPTRPIAACAAALAGLVLAAIMLPSREHRLAPAPKSSRTNPQLIVSVPSTASGATAPAPWKIPSPPQPAPRMRPVQNTNLHATKTATNQDEDAVALSEMRAPSFPAPPMPLTQQEKLLLRLVHKGAPEELAMLDPGYRARQQAQSDAEFRNFFDPPKPFGPPKPGEKQ